MFDETYRRFEDHRRYFNICSTFMTQKPQIRYFQYFTATFSAQILFRPDMSTAVADS